MIKKTYTSSGRSKISINIQDRLLHELDENRSKILQNRSTWIASAIMEKLATIKKLYKKEDLIKEVLNTDNKT